MQTISSDIVEQTWERVMSWSEDEAESKMQSVAERQPAIISYLLNVEEESIPPDDQGLMVHLGSFIIETMSPASRPLPVVEPEDIERIEDENLRWAENLAQQAVSENAETMALVPETHPQAPLLNVLFEALASGQDENSDVVTDNIGMLFLHLKTVVESLHQADAK